MLTRLMGPDNEIFLLAPWIADAFVLFLLLTCIPQHHYLNSGITKAPLFYPAKCLPLVNHPHHFIWILFGWDLWKRREMKGNKKKKFSSVRFGEKEERK